MNTATATKENTMEITLINMNDGSVAGHRAGCADIKKNHGRTYNDQPWTFSVSTKQEAWIEYNEDFVAECWGCEDHNEDEATCDNAYAIEWKPCANDLPTF